jgi:hypothetical protein
MKVSTKPVLLLLFLTCIYLDTFQLADVELYIDVSEDVSAFNHRVHLLQADMFVFLH